MRGIPRKPACSRIIFSCSMRITVDLAPPTPSFPSPSPATAALPFHATIPPASHHAISLQAQQLEHELQQLLRQRVAQPAAGQPLAPAFAGALSGLGDCGGVGEGEVAKLQRALAQRDLTIASQVICQGAFPSCFHTCIQRIDSQAGARSDGREEPKEESHSTRPSDSPKEVRGRHD